MREFESRALVASVAPLALALVVGACSSAAVEPDTPIRLQPVLGRDQQVRIASRAFLPVERLRWCGIGPPGRDRTEVHVVEWPADLSTEPEPDGGWETLEPELEDPVDALARTKLRVVDVRDGRELRGIDVPISFAYEWALAHHERLPWLLRNVSSPIDLRDLFLDSPQSRYLRLDIQARGYARQEFELDVLQGGVQTVELEPEAPLRVVVHGVEGEPPYFLRVYGAELPWQRMWTQLDHDGWLDVEGLPPGPARVEVIWNDAAGLHVAASTTLTLSSDSPERVEFTLPRRPPSDVAPKKERARFLPTRREFHPSASVHLRCGTRVLHAPIGFEVQGSPGLRESDLFLEGLALESDTAGLFEFHPPQMPGFVGPASVLIELRARESLEYVIEYERVTR